MGAALLAARRRAGGPFLCALLLLVAACTEDAAPPPQVPPPPPPNLLPVAAAGPDQSVVSGASVTLDASASADPDGVIVAFAWTQTAGPSVSLSSAAAARVTFQAPGVAGPTDFTFSVSVTDSRGAVAADSVTVTVSPAPATVEEFALTFEGRARAYTLVTPPNATSASSVVMLLHGGNGSMREAIAPGITSRRWIDLAERDGFLLIVPNGCNPQTGDCLGDDQSWNDLRNDTTGQTGAENDVGFLQAVLDDAQTRRTFNRQRQFVAGMSIGGIMAMTMQIAAPGVFIGAASFIAALPAEDVPLLTSGAPIFILNGTNDPIVLFNGGPVNGANAPTRSVAATIDYWLTSTGADRTNVATRTLPDAAPDDGCTLVDTTYRTPLGRLALNYVEAQGGGHTIPDPEPPPTTPGVGVQCRDAHGVDLAAAFFSAL